MIKYVYGDLLDSPAQVLVNTVNTVGVMGKGIAKDFKSMYPKMFLQYKKICENNLLDIGKLWIYYTPQKWILNFPTKKHWRSKSEYEYIKLGLEKFVATYKEKKITSIAFPKLGCGNGGLDWEVVRPIMEEYLDSLPIDVYVYLDNRSINLEHENIAETKKWLMKKKENLTFNMFLEDLSSEIELDDTDLMEQLHMIWNKISYNNLYIQNNKDFSNDEVANKLFRLIRNLPYIKEIEIIARNNSSSIKRGFYLTGGSSDD